jgi:beta-phosphoglucomutase-like phosphatase (HAD superfamily)
MNSIIQNYDLFIFDLDDTLIMTEKYHYASWLEVLKEYFDNTFYISFSKYCSKFHSLREDGIKYYLTEELKIENYLELCLYKNEKYFKLLSYNKNNLRLNNGVYEFLQNIINNNKKFVIATNTTPENLNFIISLFPILKKSNKNYIGGKDIKKKPSPDIFLKILIDFPDHNKIIAFEDSLTGIEALSKVPIIQTIFVNDTEYVHYNYIINNYNIITIRDFII